MAKLTHSEAARACNVARTTIQRAMKTGRLSLDAEHRVDTAALLRVGYQLNAAVLHAATPQSTADTQQNAALQHSTTQQQRAAAQELQILRQERDALQRGRDLLMQQVTMLHTMQHLLRLLDTPRQAPPPVQHPAPRSAPTPGVPRGDMRRRSLALLQEHPEGLTAGEMRTSLGEERSLADTCLGAALWAGAARGTREICSSNAIEIRLTMRKCSMQHSFPTYV